MKTAHIISHTHWDREWYLPYESHHMRLIMLIDQLLHAIDTDPDFKSFHLDGQTICIDDYLQVKPQNRERLMNAIENGKIKIGPWYILQDAFLTSAEANVRNGYYGDIDCQRYGSKNSVGYYPDTFGIYSQAPQLMRELEIDNMIFGRGVTTTGFNNEVSNGFESKYSEMLVKSSSGSDVLGILFANWYSNGNEIPVDRAEAKIYWDQKLADCEQYTNLNHLLFMNGCDHTPYQSDVTAAIKVANELYPNIEFKQSSFDEYLKAVNAEVEKETLTEISGELTSQMTDGLYTLVNTASSRINQKINNATLQDTYEFVVEPLSALYSDDYMHSEIEYGWKKLMQNHPHDSICGCSVDSVHSTMDARFEDSKNVAKHIINRTLIKTAEKLGGNEKIAFTVFNPSEIANTKHQFIVEYARQEFGSNFRRARDNMKQLTVPSLKLVDEDGNDLNAAITDIGIGFDYYLPDEKFRRPYYSRNVNVEFNYKFDKIGHQTFYIVEGETEKKSNVSEPYILENENLLIHLDNTGSFVVTNKQTGKTQTNLLEIYDQGDIGNEYMFGAIKEDTLITLGELSNLEVCDTNSMQVRKLSGNIEIPISADELLQTEQLEIIEYNTRNAKRSNEMVSVPITIEYQLDQFDTGVKVKVRIENKAKDHRIRARFTLNNNLSYHYADSAFEIVKRNNEPLETWKNSSNDQRLAKFVKLTNGIDNLFVATNGLHEYEVKDNYVDITLLRCTGELGDWGYFPTPAAQCLETIEAEMYIIFDTVSNEATNANKLRSQFVKQPMIQIYGGNNSLNPAATMLDLKHDENCYISSIKKSLDNDLVVRFGSNGVAGALETNSKFVKTNMLERYEKEMEVKEVKAQEILTIKFKD